MTPEIIDEIDKRKQLRESKQFNAYKKQRNNVKALIKKAKVNYHNNLLSESPNDATKIWQSIRELESKKKHSVGPSVIKDGGLILHDPLDIVEAKVSSQSNDSDIDTNLSETGMFNRKKTL